MKQVLRGGQTSSHRARHPQPIHILVSVFHILNFKGIISLFRISFKNYQFTLLVLLTTSTCTTCSFGFKCWESKSNFAALLFLEQQLDEILFNLSWTELEKNDDWFPSWKGWCQPTSEAFSPPGGEVLSPAAAGSSRQTTPLNLLTSHYFFHFNFQFTPPRDFYSPTSKQTTALLMDRNKRCLLCRREGAGKAEDSDQGQPLHWEMKQMLYAPRNYLSWIFWTSLSVLKLLRKYATWLTRP